MANPAFVQGKSTGGFSNANPIALTFTSSVTTGNTIVVLICVQSTIAVNSFTDSQSNTYTQLYNTVVGTGSNKFYVYYSINVTGGASFQVKATPSGTGWGFTMVAQEFSNISSLDVNNTSSGSSTANPQSTGSVTTTAANDMVVAMMAQGTTTTMTAGTGYANITTDTSNTLFYTGMESALQASIGSYNPTIATSSTGFGFTTATLAFKGPTSVSPVGKLFGTETSPSTTTLQAVNRAARY